MLTTPIELILCLALLVAAYLLWRADAKRDRDLVAQRLYFENLLVGVADGHITIKRDDHQTLMIVPKRTGLATRSIPVDSFPPLFED